MQAAFDAGLNFVCLYQERSPGSYSHFLNTGSRYNLAHKGAFRSFGNPAVLSSRREAGVNFKTKFSVRAYNLLRLLPRNIAINILAILVGLLTGLLAVAFMWMLTKLSVTVQDIQPISERFAHFNWLIWICVPALGGLLTGFIVSGWAPEAKGHGVPELMEAMALKKGVVKLRVVFAKIIASAITIASGGSAGREGPVVQIGGSIGSVIGKFVRLTPARMRWLISCGAAAGIACLFNAPIAGAIFSFEVLLRGYSKRSFITIIFASVAGAIIGRIAFGNHPSFLIPPYSFVTHRELPLFLLTGAFAAGGALAFVSLLYFFEARFDKARMPRWLKPALGGALLGLLALAVPSVRGTGLLAIEKILTNDLESLFSIGSSETVSVRFIIFGLFIGLALAKLLATSFTLGSGGSGGIFSPSLMIGASMGAAFGYIAPLVDPAHSVANPGAYALLGMAASFAAAAQAPLTAMIMVFEMTKDYHLILPLMLAVGTSTLIYNHYNCESIYTLKLKLRGTELRTSFDYNILEEIKIGEIMQKNVETLKAGDSFCDALDLMDASHHGGFPVVDDEGKLVGILTLDDIAKRKHLEYRDYLTVERIMTSDLVTIGPDNNSFKALHLLETHSIGRLPVVDPENGRLAGIVTKTDILHAYELSLKRHFELYEV